jgi:hypothetical protein
MLKKTLFVASLVLAATLASPAAQAGPIQKLAGKLNSYAKTSVDMFDKAYENSFTSLDKLENADACFAAIAKAKQDGVKPDDHISDYWILQIHPKKQESGGEKYILFSDAPWICENYQSGYDAKRAELVAEQAKFAIEVTLKKKPEDVSDSIDWTIAANECSRIAQEVAAVQGSREVDVKGTKVKISKIDETYCKPMLAAAEELKAAVAAVRASKAEAIRKKYTDLGVAGDRLELFVEYDHVPFFAKGCVQTIDDVKKLVKAKQVFHWLANADGTHTIRKYTFKGNKYKVSEKTYATEAKAYKGCK